MSSLHSVLECTTAHAAGTGLQRISVVCTERCGICVRTFSYRHRMDPHPPVHSTSRGAVMDTPQTPFGLPRAAPPSRPQPRLCTVRRHRSVPRTAARRRPQGWPRSGHRPPAPSRSTPPTRRTGPSASTSASRRTDWRSPPRPATTTSTPIASLWRCRRTGCSSGSSGTGWTIPPSRCSCPHRWRICSRGSRAWNSRTSMKRRTSSAASRPPARPGITRSTASGWTGPATWDSSSTRWRANRCWRCCGSWRKAWSSAPMGCGRRTPLHSASRRSPH